MATAPPKGYTVTHINSLSLVLTISLMTIVFLPTIIHGSIIKREIEDNHRIYARNAKPYANLVYDKSLPFVPRYRYPVRQYYGKRNGGLYYGNEYNPTMYDDDVEWSPFMDAFSQNAAGLSKRPFSIRPSSPRLTNI